MQHRPHIFDLTPDSLREIFTEWGLPPFRAGQVLEWVYQKHVADPAAMTNLSKRDRDLLAEQMRFLTGRVVAHQTATDGVQKLLMDWAETPEVSEVGEGNVGLTVLADAKPQAVRAAETECVMIPTPERKTACISSQIGCPVGCKFCASGLGGLDGNLTAGQIVEQVWQLGALPETGRVSNVVFMGMGEPLSNFDNVVKAVRTLHADWGMGISARKITISTVGLPAQIRRLADMELPVTLALSLHAPNDLLRRQLIPWAEYVTIEQLFEACDHYFQRTGREITLEYILLRDTNDRPEHARELARSAKRLRANVNLIRYNEVNGLPFGRPETDDVLEFQRILKQAGINTHIRASRGRDIAAACGQLRHEKAVAGK
ncbi:MAG: 23S rRNA (adenine(2503)-C(2))-methyltransferase RlmN [Planctomycetes bacterium]|nr:23S rRNA (adenine(2503)-C(2))-methyltransferase RlmN [Planctomycetota bacterium]